MLSGHQRFPYQIHFVADTLRNTELGFGRHPILHLIPTFSQHGFSNFLLIALKIIL